MKFNFLLKISFKQFFSLTVTHLDPLKAYNLNAACGLQKSVQFHQRQTANLGLWKRKTQEYLHRLSVSINLGAG